ncbi:uncharacterized protein LOC142578419 [Dermacentor variabilis]|uniref:uncharacterized protein LOC142578419 n=1 Tax=Dermacentor variabilis TaxID=34621 RepID=UPI003F5B5EDA
MSRLPTVVVATASLFLLTVRRCEADAAAPASGVVTTPASTPGSSPKPSTRSTEYKNMDSQTLERTLSELRYGVELLVSKVTLLEPRLGRMDSAIGRLERALLRDRTTSESHAGYQTRFPPRPIGYATSKGCGSSSSSLSSSGDKASTAELASIGDQLRDLRDEQRFFRHMLGDLRNYTTHSSDRIVAKLEQRGFLLARPAVNIQTSRPVIVGGKTSANGAAHLLRPQVLPWESQPSMSSGTLSSSGTGSARPLHMVELKNNHRSPTGSTPPFRIQGTSTAHRRQDKVRGIFTDLFGSTRTNIAKHLRQATESVRRDTEVPLSRVTDLADSLDGQARKLPDLRAELAESAAAARVLELRVFTEDAYEPLRAAASLASRAAADLEKRMPPMLQKVAETATGLRAAIGDLRGALENATATMAPNDAYYVALSEEDDFWKR